MFFALRNSWGRYRLRRAQAPVSRTPPLCLRSETGPVVLTQLRHDDVYMYLVAIKSFARFVLPARVCILNDGSLRNEDLELLRTHLPYAEFLEIGDFRSASYPMGGCWERLAALVRLCREGYVMQLDADTVTLDAPDEVADAVRQGTAFVLGTSQGASVVAAAAAASQAAQFRSEGDRHVQTAAEAVLAGFAETPELRYVRGCAALTGVPENALTTETLESWSMKFAEKLEGRWREWGTEQFMSNFLIANLEGARVLSRPHYAGCSGGMLAAQKFVHFAGYCRFSGRRYHRLSRQIIAQLCAVDAERRGR